MFGKDSKSQTYLGGGMVTVYGKDGSQAQLTTDKNGGSMAIFNNEGRNVLQTGVTHTGTGTISTRDKFGYTTGACLKV